MSECARLCPSRWVAPLPTLRRQGGLSRSPLYPSTSPLCRCCTLQFATVRRCVWLSSPLYAWEWLGSPLYYSTSPLYYSTSPLYMQQSGSVRHCTQSKLQSATVSAAQVPLRHCTCDDWLGSPLYYSSSPLYQLGSPLYSLAGARFATVLLQFATVLLQFATVCTGEDRRIHFGTVISSSPLYIWNRNPLVPLVNFSGKNPLRHCMPLSLDPVRHCILAQVQWRTGSVGQCTVANWN